MMQKKTVIFTAVMSAACLAAAVLLKKHREKIQEEAVPTCGGCFNNCYLTAPGCRIGMEKAKAYRESGNDHETDIKTSAK